MCSVALSNLTRNYALPNPLNSSQVSTDYKTMPVDLSLTKHVFGLVGVKKTNEKEVQEFNLYT